MSIGARIKSLLDGRDDLPQAELARRVKMSQAGLNGLILGKQRDSKFLPQIARELGTTTAYLHGETDDPSAGALPAPTAELVADQLDALLVPFFHNLEHAMGEGAGYIDEPATVEMIPIKREWVRGRMRGGPADLMLLQGRGDSMQPTINDGDVLLVDRSQQRIEEPDAIWAFGYAETGYIKRLRPLPGSQVEVNSDNPAVRTWTASKADIHMVGRVITIMRWQ